MHSNRIGGLGATYAVHLRLIGKLVGYFLLVIIELFSLDAFVLSQYTRLTDGQTDRISTAKCDLVDLVDWVYRSLCFQLGVTAHGPLGLLSNEQEALAFVCSKQNSDCHLLRVRDLHRLRGYVA